VVHATIIAAGNDRNGALFPIRDDNPTRHRPILTILVIAACVVVFFSVQPIDELASAEFLYENAAISCEILSLEPLTVNEITSGTCGVGTQEAFPSKNILGSMFASIFLHANIVHLGANMWSLWIFGNNVEDRLRGFRFVRFYLGTGLIATLAFVLMNPSSTVPLIGASGAIAGVMGAYLILFPRATVTAIVPPFFFFPFRVPAVLFLIIWFATQFLISDAAGSVAWEAHVGGFIAGVAYATLRNRSLRR
jgi:membrane associated rhomboid family serine protease